MKYCPDCKSLLEHKQVESKSLLVCSSSICNFIFWDNPIPVVLGLVSYEGKYVITNNIEWPDWKYSLISGFIDSGESPEKAISREVKEELSLRVIATDLITVSFYEKLNQIMISYHVETEGDLLLNSENRAFKLLNINELEKWEFGIGASPTIKKWLSNLKDE